MFIRNETVIINSLTEDEIKAGIKMGSIGTVNEIDTTPGKYALINVTFDSGQTKWISIDQLVLA